MFFKRESERQDQEPHCKPSKRRTKPELDAKKKFKMNVNKKEPETGKILIAKRFVKTWKHEDVIDLFTVPCAILDMQSRTRENEAGVDLR